MRTYHNYTLEKIIFELQQELSDLENKEIFEFSVINPDIASSTYNGTELLIDGKKSFYRGYKTWIELAQLLGCRMLTPKELNATYIIIRYEKLNSDSSFHNVITDKEEKYGTDSIFTQIHKNEEASFIYYYLQALKNVNIKEKKRILNLGVNSGDEFEAIIDFLQNTDNMEFIGIDFCASAISQAREKFSSYDNFTFIQHDINELNVLKLGEFDLIISIGTLQSSNLHYNTLLMSIVQNQLKRDGAMILGFPNCRWIDGEMVYGARVKNYNFSEMGLLYKDVIFAKKYLQQKKFRVTLTGKDYVFLTATSIKK
ncbi:MAG: methyltransferase domain-containing protein [Campylobacterales bacterium]|nr:methyltransferase domain-containing protein [Campylobacterales bacterium]